MDILERIYSRVRCLGDFLNSLPLCPDLVYRKDKAGYKAFLGSTMLGIPEGHGITSGPLDFKQYSDQREVVKRVLCRLDRQGKRGKNVLLNGFHSWRAEGDFQGLPSSMEVPNNNSTQLINPYWSKLLSRIGDAVMMHVLEHLSVFTTAPPSCFIQLTGTPLSMLIASAVMENKNIPSRARQDKAKRHQRTEKDEEKSGQSKQSENKNYQNKNDQNKNDQNKNDQNKNDQNKNDQNKNDQNKNDQNKNDQNKNDRNKRATMMAVAVRRVPCTKTTCSKDGEASSRGGGGFKADAGRDGDGEVLSKRKRAEDDTGDGVGSEAKRRKILRTEDSTQVEFSAVRLVNRKQESKVQGKDTHRNADGMSEDATARHQIAEEEENLVNDDDNDDGDGRRDGDTETKSKDVDMNKKKKKRRRRRQRSIKRKRERDLESKDVLDEGSPEVMGQIRGLDRTFFILDTCYSRITGRAWPKQELLSSLPASNKGAQRLAQHIFCDSQQASAMPKNHAVGQVGPCRQAPSSVHAAARKEGAPEDKAKGGGKSKKQPSRTAQRLIKVQKLLKSFLSRHKKVNMMALLNHHCPITMPTEAMPSEPSNVRGHQGSNVSMDKRLSLRKENRFKKKASLRDSQRTERIEVGGAKSLGELQDESKKDGFIPVVFRRKTAKLEPKKSQNECSRTPNELTVSERRIQENVVFSESHTFDDYGAEMKKIGSSKLGSKSLDPSSDTRPQKMKVNSDGSSTSAYQNQSRRICSAARKRKMSANANEMNPSSFGAEMKKIAVSKLLRKSVLNPSSNTLPQKMKLTSKGSLTSTRNQYQSRRVCSATKKRKISSNADEMNPSSGAEMKKIAFSKLGSKSFNPSSDSLPQKRKVTSEGSVTSTRNQNQSRRICSAARKRKMSSNADEINPSSVQKRACKDSNYAPAAGTSKDTAAGKVQQRRAEFKKVVSINRRSAKAISDSKIKRKNVSQRANPLSACDRGRERRKRKRGGSLERSESRKRRLPDDPAALIKMTHAPWQVYLFLRHVLLTVVPSGLWGSSHNRNVFLKGVKQFIKLGKFEKLTLKQLVAEIKVEDCDWSQLEKFKGCSPPFTSLIKQRQLVTDFFHWLMASYVIPLMKLCFYGTETSSSRNQLVFYRKSVWFKLEQQGIKDYVANGILKPIKQAEADKMMSEGLSLGFSRLRFVPKVKSLRPITRMGKCLLPDKRGLHNRILLQDLFDVLTYHKKRQPSLFGSSLLGMENIYSKLVAFIQDRKARNDTRPLYFVKVDIKKCYDSIKHQKLQQIISLLLEGHDKPDEYQAHRYVTVTLNALGNPHKTSRRLIMTGSAAAGSFHRQLIGMAKSRAVRNAVIINRVSTSKLTPEGLLQRLRQHVMYDILKIGRRCYWRREGISQGSILSSLLCSFFYAHLERCYLSGVDQEGLLMRLIDDFLLITPHRDKTERFLQVLLSGVKQYGCEVNPSKTLANFDFQFEGHAIPRVTQGGLFPWCGLVFDMQTLDVSNDYARYSDVSLRYTLTMQTDGESPLHTMGSKFVQSLKTKSVSIFLDPQINSFTTIVVNVYHLMLLLAFRFHSYYHCLPGEVRDAAKPSQLYGVVALCLRRFHALAVAKLPRDGKDNETTFPLTTNTVKWIGLKAFDSKLSLHRAVYKPLLGLIRNNRRKAALVMGKGSLASLEKMTTPTLPADFTKMKR